MKKYRRKDLIYWACVVVVAILLGIAITSCESDTEHHKSRIYELVDKTTEVSTHRYWLVENAIATDYILIWKSENGRTFPCEVSRSSYYYYEVGKRYRFVIDDRYSAQSQISAQCR